MLNIQNKVDPMRIEVRRSPFINRCLLGHITKETTMARSKSETGANLINLRILEPAALIP